MQSQKRYRPSIINGTNRKYMCSCIHDVLVSLLNKIAVQHNGKAHTFINSNINFYTNILQQRT